MKLFYSLISYIFLAITITVAHLGIVFFLPYPYSAINILFIFFTLHILKTEGGRAVWLAFISFFIIELYSTLPFGITLFSATIAVLFGYWLFQRIFTNRSWYTASVLCFCMILIYRIIYSTFLMGTVLATDAVLGWNHIIVRFSWEILISTVSATVLFLLLQLIRPPRKTTIFMRV